MGDRTRVRYAAYWNSEEHLPDTRCGFEKIAANSDIANNFISTMSEFDHEGVYAAGNLAAWASDFEHPELDHVVAEPEAPPQRGESLDWVDNVHIVFVAGHGARELCISFPSDHFGCRAYYKNMRLGVGLLRWLILGICDAVTDTGDSVMRVWSGPSEGDKEHPRRSLHLVCTAVGKFYENDIVAGRSSEFATSISLGTPVGSAWLDAEFDRSGGLKNVPIAIAFGVDEADAIARRDFGGLADRDLGPVVANWLAWKWRE
jgi:hypothetical protein